MERYVCIHGHFYQPPRANPWLETVEREDSAHPYHDWNERITAECYGPNSASRVLNPDGRIIDIMNNYSRISFDFGPTLLAWMEYAQPDIYRSVLDADKLSQQRHGGHGSALAQPYNHVIMPLASSRDRRTQVLWGLRDFEQRFGREAEGMWLPETAVDLESLDLLAELGVRFTILAQRQAARVRRIDEGEDWHEVSGSRIDPKQPYLCRLPSGRAIVLFFYVGPIAREAAFEGLLHNGENFANRLIEAFTDEGGAQLVHIATDGETYGHYHRRGEMALTYCLHHIESNQLARITNYASFLEEHPPTHEVEIFESSSWSCVHGVERWRADCGCSTGRHEEWHQGWRAPLRAALEWLRDEMTPFYEERAGQLFEDPWAVRDAYIDVILDRAPENVSRFLRGHARRELSDDERVMALRLLESQRHAQLMFTSGGWFFDELSGMEAQQVLKYASRAIQLVRDAHGPDLEGQLRARLEAAPSNLPEQKNGKVIYDKLIRPARIGITRVAAHHAISSLLQGAQEQPYLAFTVEPEGAEVLHAGKSRLGIGRLRVRSKLIGEQRDLFYAVLHMGDHHINGGIRDYGSDAQQSAIAEAVKEPFERGDIPEALRQLDAHFGDDRYSMWHLFGDQQREIMTSLFQDAERMIESFYQQVYQTHYHLLQALVSLSMPLPPVFQATVEFVINSDLRRCLGSYPIDQDELHRLEAELQRWPVAIDRELLGLLGTAQIDRLVHEWADSPLDYSLLDELAQLFDNYSGVGIPLNLWRSQNTLYEIGLQQFFLRSKMAERGDEMAASWVQRFKRVSNILGVRFD